MKVESWSGTIISIPFQNQKIDGLYYHLVTHDEHVRNKPVFLRLHGLLGNLLDETEHDLPYILAKYGYSSITINTIMANLGLFFGFGIFDEAMPQIHAACTYLRQIRLSENYYCRTWIGRSHGDTLWRVATATIPIS